MSVLTDLIVVQCDACDATFEIARCDLGCGLALCDDCNDEFADKAANDVFETALWNKYPKVER
jgi:hypothetical protein